MVCLSVCLSVCLFVHLRLFIGASYVCEWYTVRSGISRGRFLTMFRSEPTTLPAAMSRKADTGRKNDRKNDLFWRFFEEFDTFPIWYHFQILIRFVYRQDTFFQWVLWKLISAKLVNYTTNYGKMTNFDEKWLYFKRKYLKNSNGYWNSD